MQLYRALAEDCENDVCEQLLPPPPCGFTENYTDSACVRIEKLRVAERCEARALLDMQKARDLEESREDRAVRAANCEPGGAPVELQRHPVVNDAKRGVIPLKCCKAIADLEKASTDPMYRVDAKFKRDVNYCHDASKCRDEDGDALLRAMERCDIQDKRVQGGDDFVRELHDYGKEVGPRYRDAESASEQPAPPPPPAAAMNRKQRRGAIKPATSDQQRDNAPTSRKDHAVPNTTMTPSLKRILAKAVKDTVAFRGGKGRAKPPLNVRFYDDADNVSERSDHSRSFTFSSQAKERRSTKEQVREMRSRGESCAYRKPDPEYSYVSILNRELVLPPTPFTSQAAPRRLDAKPRDMISMRKETGLKSYRAIPEAGELCSVKPDSAKYSNSYGPPYATLRSYY